MKYKPEYDQSTGGVAANIFTDDGLSAGRLTTQWADMIQLREDMAIMGLEPIQ